MKIWKKCLLAAGLTGTLLLGVVGTAAAKENVTLVDSGVSEDGLSWSLDQEGTLRVSGNGAMMNRDTIYNLYYGEISAAGTSPWKNHSSEII